MTPADLARIHTAAFTDTRPWTEAEFVSLLAQPGTVLIEQGYAFIIGRVVVDEAEILTVACDPEGQRRGHARTALSLFETCVAQMGANRVFLEVSADNTAAKALYTGAGFVMTGRRRDYYCTNSGHRTDALILAKALTGVNALAGPS